MKNKSHLFLLSMAMIILMFTMSACSLKKQTNDFLSNQEVFQSGEIKNEVKAYKLGDEKKLLADWNEENPPLNDSGALVIPNLPSLFTLHGLKHKNLEFNFQVLTGEISARIDIIFPKNLNKTRIPLGTGIKAGGTLKIKLGDYQQFFNPKAGDIALIISATKNGKKDGAENTYISYTTILGDEKGKLEKIELQKAEKIEIETGDLEIEELGKLSTTITFANALDTKEYLFSGENNKNNANMCMLSCGGNYRFEHSVTEEPGVDCNNRWVVLPKSGVKIFSWKWNGKELNKNNLINNKGILLSKDKETKVFLYKIPEGQNFEDTIKVTRSGVFEKVLPKQLDYITQNSNKQKWYKGFGNTINSLDSDKKSILKSKNKIFLFLKSQPKNFFVFENYSTSFTTPLCPEYLFDSIE